MRLEISCQDRLGITLDILNILVEHQIDLRGIEVDPVGRIFLNFPNIEFADFQHLMPEIRRIKGIDDVKTTPFMPIEREKNQLRALIESVPDPVFSIDTRGRILLINNAVKTSLRIDNCLIEDKEVTEFIKGFNFVRWMEKANIEPLAHKVKFIEQDFLADILPVTVPDTGGQGILAGAVIMLKSEFRLGQQMTQFRQTYADSFSSFQANSSLMRQFIRDAKQLAEQEEPMLLFGESGTGKSMLARACHEASRRTEGPFVQFDFATVASQQSLFGKEQDGVLLEAIGGTLYLRNIDAMQTSVQQQLLDALQNGTVWSPSTKTHQDLDCRLICATKANLQALVDTQKLSAELFYRLNIHSLVVPPLRERKSDIVALAETIVKKRSTKLGRQVPKLTKACKDFLQQYPWQGNIRQFENALHRALSLLDGNEMGSEYLQVPASTETLSFMPKEFEGSLEQEVKRYEKEVLTRLYPHYPSTRQLAKKLKLSHTAIANKLREYGINKQSIKSQ